MSDSSRLPGSLRDMLQHALDLARQLQAPGQTGADELDAMLEELRSLLSQAQVVVRSSSLPQKLEIARPLRAASGLLVHLNDPAQRDARPRLRAAARHIQEVLE